MTGREADSLGTGRIPGGLAGSIVPWVMSGRSKAELREKAQRLWEFVSANPELTVGDVGLSLAMTWSSLAHRTVLVGADRDRLVDGLAAVARGGVAPGLVQGVVDAAGKVAFVFPGQGSQWTGMALRLWQSSPFFAERMDACEQALSQFVDWSLIDVLRRESGAPSLDRVDVVQPALFAVMVSLAELWRSYGVRPDVVVGHSQGEIAAACVAGALSLEDAARVVALRSQIIREELTDCGGMVSISLAVERVRQGLTDWGDRLSIAAVNGPESVVVSGAPQELDELIAACEDNRVRARRIPVDYASHSVQVEKIRDRLFSALSPIRSGPSEVVFHSTVTGDAIDTRCLDAEYWYNNLRNTVLFEHAIRTLVEQGFDTFVEVSPHPVLTIGLEEIFDAAGREGVVVGSLRRDEGDLKRFLLSVAEAYVRGVTPDWQAAFVGSGARTVELPTYAFQQ